MGKSAKSKTALIAGDALAGQIVIRVHTHFLFAPHWLRTAPGQRKKPLLLEKGRHVIGGATSHLPEAILLPELAPFPVGMVAEASSGRSLDLSG